MLNPAFRFLPIRLTRCHKGPLPSPCWQCSRPYRVGGAKRHARAAEYCAAAHARGDWSAASQAHRINWPRVAARQSKRAVRAVAAAPGSESSIVQVGQLGALQDAPIGLETGYGSELWRGARLALSPIKWHVAERCALLLCAKRN